MTGIVNKGCNIYLPSEGFLSDEDIDRCSKSLLKLKRHLSDPFYITGGIASRLHLSRRGVTIPLSRLNDIDIVVDGGLSPSLCDDFLIRHFHPNRGGGRILIMLVDESTKMRIDVFTPTTPSLSDRSGTFTISNTDWQVVSVEDLLVKLLSIIYPVVKLESVDPKYFDYFNLLSKVADLNRAKELWCEYQKTKEMPNFDEAVEACQKYVVENPGLLQTVKYSQNLSETCSWCFESEQFPLAPLSRIYEILGYV